MPKVAAKYWDDANKEAHALRVELEDFKSQYMDLARFIRPTLGRFYLSDINKGGPRYNRIINNTATIAHKKAVAGLRAGTMPQTRPWFQYEPFNDPELREYGPARTWLDYAAEMARKVLASSNFYTTATTTMGDVLQFATGGMIHDDDFEDVANFFCPPTWSYAIALDHKFRVRVMSRKYQMTVDQLVTKFGLENCSTSVRTAYDNGNYFSYFPVMHLIRPNRELDDQALGRESMPFESLKLEPGGQTGTLLQHLGNWEFPGYFPRWDVTGEDIYGTDCPAMTALGDVKQLQSEERDKGMALNKMVKPPLKGPASLRNAEVSQLPGGITLYEMTGSEGLGPLYEVRFDINAVTMDIKEVERRINDAFMLDVLMAFTNIDGVQPRNELDLTIRNEERLLQLGPTLERQQFDWVDPMHDRLFNQMIRAQILPPPPRELQGQELRVRHTSAMAMAQRALSLGGIDRVIATLNALVSLGYEEARDKFDADQSIDEIGLATGVPSRLIVPDDDVERIRERRRALQEQERAAQLAQQGAEAARAASQADLTGDNLLSRMADSVQQQRTQ